MSPEVVVLVSVLTPFYAPNPTAPAVETALRAYLAALAAQPGPAEVLVAVTIPGRRCPLSRRLPELAGPGFPHDLRVLSLPFDPRRQPPRSRAEALNAAAAVARGELFVLLHADVRLPPGALAAIRAARATGYRAGAFPKRYDLASPLMRLQARYLNDWSLRRRGRTVGTNAVWLARDLWRPLPTWRLLEDFVLSDRLQAAVGARGLHVAERCVEVSADKYARSGPLASVVLNALVLGLWRLGVHPDILFDDLYSRSRLPVGELAFWPALVRQGWRAWRRRRG